jgi:hypothetical protein
VGSPDDRDLDPGRAARRSQPIVDRRERHAAAGSTHEVGSVVEGQLRGPGGFRCFAERLRESKRFDPNRERTGVPEASGIGHRGRSLVMSAREMAGRLSIPTGPK